MKFFLLLTFLSFQFMLFGQNRALSEEEIIQEYPNTACGYFNADGDLLFDGGEFQKEHPDSKLIATYQCVNFSGEYFESSSYHEVFSADIDGNIILPLFDSIEDESRNELARFYWDENGELASSICWNKLGEEVDCQ